MTGLDDKFEAVRHEGARLAALAACAVLDTPREAAFDNIAFTVSQLFRAPFALLTLVDEKRAWAKAAVGPIDRCADRGETFCNLVIQQSRALVVEDAAADPRFAMLRLVREDPWVRFLAGAPLIGPGRQAIGALCVFDRQPRSVSDVQRGQLEQLAHQAGELLRLRVPNLDVSA